MIVIGFWTDSINAKRIDILIKEKYIKISNELFENIENKNQLTKLFTKYDLELKKEYLENKNDEVLYENNLTFREI